MNTTINISNKKNNKLDVTINKFPVKLVNKNGANICWWNAFAQLLATTRNVSIVNKLNMFINETERIYEQRL